jgi:hypothetical protein
LSGSASCSPRKFGPPVHWFVFTTKRRWVAFVFGMSNERRIRAGDTGRGELPGKASAPLVYTLLKPASVEQLAVSLLHAHTSN